MKETLYEFCLRTGRQELLNQWDQEKNRSFTPGTITKGSRKKVWWKCEKGHEWQTLVSTRTGQNTGCPVCAGKLIIPGENDMASAFPELVSSWHSEKNGTLTPQMTSQYSNRRVWWICEKGHEWQTAVAHRTVRGTGCPVCSGKKVLAGYNDLCTTHPEIAIQWHPTLNGDLSPEMVSPGSNSKAWWVCELDHVWKAFIYSRTCNQKHGCPVCAGKVKKKTYVEMASKDN